jgi:hypothetical protein
MLPFISRVGQFLDQLSDSASKQEVHSTVFVRLCNIEN